MNSLKSQFSAAKSPISSCLFPWESVDPPEKGSRQLQQSSVVGSSATSWVDNGNSNGNFRTLKWAYPLSNSIDLTFG
jgi:hypothetical protein